MDRRKLGELAEYTLSAILLIVILLNVISTFMPYASADSREYDTFGNTSSGGTSHYTDEGIIGCEFNATVDLDSTVLRVESITAWLRTLDASAHNAHAAIYLSSDLSLVANSTGYESVTVSAYYTFDFPEPYTYITKYENYTLAVWCDDKLQTYYVTGYTGQTSEDDTASYPNWGDPLTEDNTYAQETKIYCTVSEHYDFQYTFYGLYDENTGLPSGDIDVTAHFTEIGAEEFNVDGSYEFGSDSLPLYFSYNLTDAIAREYWLDSTGENGTAIYLFNSTTPAFTVYTIQFYDLAGILDSESIIQAERMVNATTFTVEKRRVDVQDKVLMSLVNGELYTLTVIDAADESTYVYGSLRMTAVTTVSLTLKGIEFPKETLLTYSNVRLYGERAHDNPTGNITLVYEDTLEETIDVSLDIDFINGTDVYYNSGAMQSFIYEYTSADNASSYMATITVNHSRYGVFVWKQTFPREGFDANPFGLAWFGSLPFDTSYLLPGFIILLTAACFSVLSVEAGAFMTVVMAAALAFMGWLPIPGATLIVAFALAVLMGIVLAKRRLVIG